MPYIGTQPNDVKKNTGLYTPSEILQLTKDGSWGGSLELIETIAPDGVQNVTTSVLPTNYDVIKVEYDFYSSSAGNVLYLQFYESGVLQTGAVYKIAQRQRTPGGVTYDTRNTGDTKIYLGNFGSGGQGGGYFYLFNASNASKITNVTYQHSDNRAVTSWGGGNLAQASVVDKLYFRNSSLAYNFLSGSLIKIYGLKKI
jgi:hypothetical protein